MGIKLIPFKNKKTISIVYVHGFMGDNDTFYDFPDLLKVTMQLYNVNVINKIYPAFSTNGEFEKSVDKFIKWLYNENDENIPVVLMGHSMGGILIADAYNKISEGEVDNELKRKIPPNIIGVFGYDSPYFGLANTSVANAGMRRIKETVSAANGLISSFFSNNNIQNSNLTTTTITSEKAITTTTTNDKNLPNTNTKSQETSDISNDENNNSLSKDNSNASGSNWGLLSKYLTVGIGAVAASAAIGATLLNQNTREALISSSQQILTESTKYIHNYGIFLEPLIEFGKQNERIDYLINHVKFKNYYPITEIKNENETIQNTFIKVPNKGHIYSNFFDSLPGAKNATDPIYSHTNMFNSLTNCENVNYLANKCIKDLYELLIL